MRWKMSILVLALVSAGCGQSGNVVSGKILFHEEPGAPAKPVNYGTVVIVGSDGLAHVGIIKNGSYAVRGVARGTAKIAVTSPDPAGSDLSPVFLAQLKERNVNLPAVATDWFPIPERYGDPEQSNLKIEVGRGTTSYDIPLKE